mmetsp:Transcript_4645/g.10232  ORF Transcript_4645/g.10232 Transcript_4645/m.10232 type:complete len:207 (-) Transcript_4645:812-1432(-)
MEDQARVARGIQRLGRDGRDRADVNRQSRVAGEQTWCRAPVEVGAHAVTSPRADAVRQDLEPPDIGLAGGAEGLGVGVLQAGWQQLADAEVRRPVLGDVVRVERHEFRERLVGDVSRDVEHLHLGCRQRLPHRLPHGHGQRPQWRRRRGHGHSDACDEGGGGTSRGEVSDAFRAEEGRCENGAQRSLCQLRAHSLGLPVQRHLHHR